MQQCLGVYRAPSSGVVDPRVNASLYQTFALINLCLRSKHSMSGREVGRQIGTKYQAKKRYWATSGAFTFWGRAFLNAALVGRADGPLLALFSEWWYGKF